MRLADIVSGSKVFIDANIFVYALAPVPQFGPECMALLKRVEQGDVEGYASTHVLSDVAHRLMTFEACATFAWPYAGIAQRIKKHPADIQLLSKFRDAIKAIIGGGITFIPVLPQHVLAAAEVSLTSGLMSDDALVIALMNDQGLATLASGDADFDRIPAITRAEPL